MSVIYRDKFTRAEYTEEQLYEKMCDCIGECELWDMMQNYSFNTIWEHLDSEFKQELWDVTLDFYKNHYYERIEQ